MESAAGSGVVDDEEDDVLAYLEQKQLQVAAMQQAAEVAREATETLVRAQRRAAEIEEMVNSPGSAAGDAAAPDLPLVGEGEVATFEAQRLHEHPLSPNEELEPWVCDRCGTEHPESEHSRIRRFSCQGCDFDLCERCHGTNASSFAAHGPSSPSPGTARGSVESCLSPEDRRRFGLDAPSAAGAAAAAAL
mmetsp:Transcript_43927/g.117745  ORF Transcript_43927/g.117745 Transcript_43927/m.117745 type:complete len:191 (-) Transcript_43927:6-578(-)